MPGLTRQQFLFSLLGLGVSTTAYSRFFEARWLEVTHEQVPLYHRRLSESLRLLHLSDLHASPVVPYEYLEEAIEVGIAHDPDLICLTGDFITADLSREEEYRRILKKLSSRAPTFACLGNHDGGDWARRRFGFSHTRKIRKLLNGSGITCLINDQQVVRLDHQALRIVGLGDLWAKMFSAETSFAAVAPGDGIPIVVLSHNPDSKEMLAGYHWDLMLSGHTHGGQIRIPFLGAPFAPVIDKRYVEGLQRWRGRWIHITRGVGNVYGIRINCRPQVSILHLQESDLM